MSNFADHNERWKFNVNSSMSVGGNSISFIFRQNKPEHGDTSKSNTSK